MDYTSLEPQSQGTIWTENLNFTYDGNEIPDNRSGSSKKNITWHMQQADILFKAYNYCQGREDGGEARGRRNVLTASLGIIYQDKSGYNILYIDPPRIYIDGWETTDVPLPTLQKEENKQIQKKFVSLSNIDSFSKLKEMQVISNQDRLGYEFKHTKCHSEQTLLLDLAKNIDRLITPLKNKEVLSIHGFILNVASLRDVCSNCQGLFSSEIFEGKLLLNQLKLSLSKEYSIQKNAGLVILASGMSAYGEKSNNTRSNLPFKTTDNDRQQKVIQLHTGDAIMYHTTNPCYATYDRDLNQAQFKILKGW